MMNHVKKFLLITFWIFASIESNSTGAQKKLKPKLQRQNKKIVKEVGQIFTTDDQSQIAKEVNDVQLLAQTPEQKKEVAQALQKEIVKQTKEIKNDLEKDNKSIPKYIEYMDALDIIKSKKELSEIKNSSWTNSYIVKPLTKTYRLFLRVWDQKKYAELLEQERTSLEHALNVQAHNNLMLLYVTLDLATKQQDLNIEHMFKKDNFYKITLHAFEGGALFASDINLSQKLRHILIDLGVYTEHLLNKIILKKISHSPEIIQSIYTMVQIIDQAKASRSQNIAFMKKIEMKDDFWVKEAFLDTIFLPGNIKELCQKAAKIYGQKLVENKESYTQYLQKWISEPKNVAKVGFVIAAIGGLYIYGPAVPAWLKEYSTSSIGSIKGALSKGYNATISSVKNLWNKISGNKTQEMPDFKEARMDAQQQQSDLDDYFIQQGSKDAQDIETIKNIEDKKEDKRIADLAEKRKIAREEEAQEKYRQEQAEKKTEALLLGIQEVQAEDVLQDEQARDLQMQGQILKDLDDEQISEE